MKHIILKKIMKYIKKQSRYSNTELIEIEYGLTGIYLTISKLIILSILAIWLGIIKEMFIFMIFFNIIRTTAFGLHANKSWQCLLSSIIIFIGIPLGCKYISIETTMKMIVGLISIIFICKNAPADTKKRPIINKKRRKMLKIISTIIAILFTISSLIVNDKFISNCLLFATIVENFLISPLIYKIFHLPYNNYIDFLKSHPDFNQ